MKKFTINDLVNHNRTFFSDERSKDGNSIGIAVALEEALHQTPQGVVASLPYLIAGIAHAPADHSLRTDWHTAYSEENVGIDKKGLHVKKNTPVVLTVHSGGLLTPARIYKALLRKEGITPFGAAHYSDEEFDNLLEGKLPTGEKIKIHTLDDIKKEKITNPFGTYAIIQDFATAQKTESGWYRKKQFLKNPLVLARAGTQTFLEKYFDTTHISGTVGNWHRLQEIDPTIPQGRVLFVDTGVGDLYADNSLYSDGRFFGVGAGGAVRKK